MYTSSKITPPKYEGSSRTSSFAELSFAHKKPRCSKETIFLAQISGDWFLRDWRRGRELEERGNNLRKEQEREKEESRQLTQQFVERYLRNIDIIPLTPSLENKTQEYYEILFDYVENGKIKLSSTIDKTRAEGCAEISQIAKVCPSIITDEVVQLIIENLTNDVHFFDTPLPSISMFNELAFSRYYPAATYAREALVHIGEGSIPHLKQALIEGNKQMRERVLEVLYEISLNNPELITDDFIPLLCKYASDEDYKAKDIIEVLIKSNRTSTSESAAESEDKK
jgi:transcription termination factor NusB